MKNVEAESRRRFPEK